MTAVPVWPCEVKGARLVLQDREAFASYALALEGVASELVLRKRRTQRSLRANAYYWSVVVVIIAEHCGYETDEMHEVLAMRFLRIEDDPLTGVPRRRRTPDTNSQEFSEYVDKCKRFGAELGLYVPDAHEVDA